MPATEPAIRVINAQGGTILPGFIDCHVHLMLGKFDRMPGVGRCPWDPGAGETIGPGNKLDESPG